MTASGPVASVVVPTYRGAARLPALLDAFAGQQEGTEPFEVIVVVDGADDGSVAVVERENRFAVRLIVFPENRGRVPALNAGFDAARGSVLIRCDDDLVVPAGYVSAHVKAHSGAVPVGAVGLTRDVHRPSAYARAYGEDAAKRSFAHTVTVPDDQRWRLWAASCSITRETWARIGPYDPRYRGYGWEDVDYGYRLHAAGLPIVVAEAATAEHHGPAASARARALKAFEAGAARATFGHLHPRAPLDPVQPGRGLWGLGVAAMARASGSRAAVARLSGAIDRMLPLVPAFAGRKLVALAVEGAGLAGSRSTSISEGQQ